MKKKIIMLTIAAAILSTTAFAAQVEPNVTVGEPPVSAYAPDVKLSQEEIKEVMSKLSLKGIDVPEGSRALHSYEVSYTGADSAAHSVAKLHVYLKSDWALTPMVLIFPPVMEAVGDNTSFTYVIEPIRNNPYSENQSKDFNAFNYLNSSEAFSKIIDFAGLSEISHKAKTVASPSGAFQLTVPQGAGLVNTGLTSLASDSKPLISEKMEFVYIPVAKRGEVHLFEESTAYPVATITLYDTSQGLKIKIGGNILAEAPGLVLAADFSQENPYQKDSQDYKEFEQALTAAKEIKGSLSKKTENENGGVVTINGKRLTNQAIREASGMVFIPLREVGEALGYEVAWVADANRVELTKGPLWNAVTIGMDEYNFARMRVQLGYAPKLIDGKTYVPVTYANEVLKAQIEVDSNNNVNIVSTEKE